MTFYALSFHQQQIGSNVNYVQGVSANAYGNANTNINPTNSYFIQGDK